MARRRALRGPRRARPQRRDRRPRRDRRERDAADARVVAHRIDVFGSGPRAEPLGKPVAGQHARGAYKLKEGKVQRLAWAGIDAAPRDEPTPVTVLANVTSLAFRFLDPQGEWRTVWGAPGSNETTLPAAVEMTVDLASGERIVRMVDLPRAQ